MGHVMTWQQNLQQFLAPRPDGQPPRLAIVGVGQALRGDDGVGPALAARLAAQLATRLAANALLILDASHAPENFLGPVVRFRPDAVLFLDAARGGGAPGDIVWLLPAEADGRGGSTHALSLEMLADYLTAETGAVVRVLGIEPSLPSSCSAGCQPASWPSLPSPPGRGLGRGPAEFPFGEGLSPAVAAAADEVAMTLAALALLDT